MHGFAFWWPVCCGSPSSPCSRPCVVSGSIHFRGGLSTDRSSLGAQSLCSRGGSHFRAASGWSQLLGIPFLSTFRQLTDSPSPPSSGLGSGWHPSRSSAQPPIACPFEFGPRSCLGKRSARSFFCSLCISARCPRCRASGGYLGPLKRCTCTPAVRS